MTAIENLQPGQSVMLPSGTRGRVESVTAPIPGGLTRELVVVDDAAALVALYLGRTGEDITTTS